MMQLQHLRYLVGVVDAGTVSAAAAAAHVTQPTLSRQLRQLEADLGLPLFDRSAGRLVPNRSALTLLPAARALLRDADALRATAGFLAAGGLDRVVVAAPAVTLTDVVAPFVATMPPEDPAVDVRLADGQTTTEMLALGADLAIGTERPRPPYVGRVLAALPVWAFVPPGDSWATRRRVDLEELVERPVIALPPTFTSRRALEAAVRHRGASYRSVLEVANGTLAQAMAAAGRGVAVVSDDPRFDLVPVAVGVGEEQLLVRLVVAWDPRSAAAGALEELTDRLVRFVAGRYR